MAACVSPFQAMRISWCTKRVMALTPPTGDRVQVHGNGSGDVMKGQNISVCLHHVTKRPPVCQDHSLCGKSVFHGSLHRRCE